MTFERELEVALEITRKAGELALQFFDSATLAEEKSDASPVTIADRECEQLITRLLQEYFSQDGVLGEEGAQIHFGRSSWRCKWGVRSIWVLSIAPAWTKRFLQSQDPVASITAHAYPLPLSHVWINPFLW